MIKYTILVSIFTILLLYSVTCDDPEEVKQFGLNKARQSYRFNHPPAADDYRSIPVSVVYDKVIDRTHRRQKLIKQAEESDNKVSSPEIEETVTFSNVSEKKEKEVSSVTFENSTKMFTDNLNTPESRDIKLAFKIPVAVVYDDEPELGRANRIKSGVNTRLRKAGKRQRKPTSEPDEQTITIKPFHTNENNYNPDAKPMNSILEETSSKASLDEKPKIDLNGEKTSTRNLKRRLRTRKPDSNIVKVSNENGPEHKQSIQRQTSRSNVLRENGNHVKSKQNQETESSSLNIPADNINQETPRKAQTTETSITKETNANMPAKKREHGEPDPIVRIVASENYVYGNTGEFKYSYEGDDGTKAFSKGKLKTSDFDEEVAGEAVEGGFSYKDKEGNDFSLSYTADENGYRPVGAHLPTPPPIPPAIARALAYLATKTTPEPVTVSIDKQEKNTPFPNKTF